MANTLQIPTDFINETTVLQKINLDGLSFNIELEYNYNLTSTDEYYNEDLDYWVVIIKDTNDNELFREIAQIEFDMLKGIDIKPKPQGLLYFRAVNEGRGDGLIKKDDFTDKSRLVVLEYITKEELSENNVLR